MTSEIVLEIGRAREEAGQEGRFASRILRSPAGSSRWQDFTLPWDSEGQNEQVQKIGNVIRAGSDLDDARNFGGQLFEMLVQGEVARTFWRSWGTRPKEEGLRLRLRMDPEEPGMERILSLPWELLYLKVEDRFLGLYSRSQVSRSLDVPSPPLDRPQPPKNARLLLVVSPGRGIDWHAEEATLRELFEDRLEVLHGVSLRSLREAVARHEPHILHFVGHGHFLERRGKGLLELIGVDGRCEQVSGRQLVDTLDDFIPTLGWVVLSACSSARAPDREGCDPFASVAAALVRRGLEVVAMQFPISNVAASRFAESFYPRLLEGSSLEQAVAKGRQRIRDEASPKETLEWATPVVFQRAPAADSRSPFQQPKRIAAVIFTALIVLGGLMALGQRVWAWYLVEQGVDLHRLAAEDETPFEDRPDLLANAQAKLEKAVWVMPSCARGHNNLAQILRETGHPEEAVEHAEAAVEVEPDDAIYQYNLGGLYGRLERYGEASFHLQRALELPADEPRTHAKARNELGRIHQHFERHEEARKHFELGLELVPDLPELHKNLGWTLLDLGEPALAAVAFERALALYDLRAVMGAAEAAYGLALAQQQRGDSGGLCEALSQFWEWDSQGVSRYAREVRALDPDERCAP